MDPVRNLLTALVVERKNELWSVLFFLFLYSVTGKLYGKEIERSNKTGENVRYQTAHTERQYVVNGELNLR